MDNFTTKKDVSIPWDQFKIQKKKKKKKKNSLPYCLMHSKINKCANFCQGQLIQSFKTAVS